MYMLINSIIAWNGENTSILTVVDCKKLLPKPLFSSDPLLFSVKLCYIVL